MKISWGHSQWFWRLIKSASDFTPDMFKLQKSNCLLDWDVIGSSLKTTLMTGCKGTPSPPSSSSQCWTIQSGRPSVAVNSEQQLGLTIRARRLRHCPRIGTRWLSSACSPTIQRKDSSLHRVETGFPMFGPWLTGKTTQHPPLITTASTTTQLWGISMT